MSSQGGNYIFRYTVMSSASFEPAQLTRLGWEQMTPLESDRVPASFTPSSLTSTSFLTVDNPNVVLSTWKRAEDGEGSIVRLTEIAGRPETVQLRTPHLRLKYVQQCSLLEDCTGELPIRNDSVAVQLKPFEILTLKLLTLPEPGL